MKKKIFYNTKYIILTGGAGLVGSTLTEYLLKKKYNILIIDNLSYGKRINIVKNNRVKYINLDLSKKKSFKKIPNFSFKIIIHCAAQASNAISWQKPNHDLKYNLNTTRNLLEFCKQRKIRRFIYTSSMSVYGEPAHLPTPESSVVLPLSYYAVHKHASENYIRIYKNEYDINFTIFRLYTTYGVKQNLDNLNQGLLSIFVSYIKKNKPLVIKGSLERTRDIIHVNDVCTAISLSLNNKKTFNEIYNLGFGQAIKLKKVLELLLKGFGYNMLHYPIILQKKTQGDPVHTLADIRKLKKDINWKPLIAPEKGIAMIVKEYKKG